MRCSDRWSDGGVIGTLAEGIVGSDEGLLGLTLKLILVLL